MSRLFPLFFLMDAAAIFGILWIVFDVDPDKARVWQFLLLVFLLSFCVFVTLVIFFYFIRTRRFRRYDEKWYLLTSFKMSFFAAVFVFVEAGLAILKLISFWNTALLILALSLFSVYVYLGKKTK